MIYLITNKFINLLDMIGWHLSKTFWSFYLRILFRLKGVKLGNRTNFYGFSKIKVASGSKIFIGKNCTFRSSPTSNLIGVNKPCIISTLTKEAKLTIGENCGFSGTVIGCFKGISIGDNVKIGANSIISDGDWHYEDTRSSSPKSILVENNVWIGVNVIVLKGVTLGENCLIGAGSVVTKNIPPNAIAAGNPCKIVRII